MMKLCVKREFLASTLNKGWGKVMFSITPFPTCYCPIGRIILPFFPDSSGGLNPQLFSVIFMVSFLICIYILSPYCVGK